MVLNLLIVYIRRQRDWNLGVLSIADEFQSATAFQQCSDTRLLRNLQNMFLHQIIQKLFFHEHVNFSPTTCPAECSVHLAMSETILIDNQSYDV
jgi:hypothetical protein